MSGHRPIAPSSGRPASPSPSGSTISGEQSSTSHSGTTGVSSVGSSGGEPSRRRRHPGQVSSMACTECRHARQKCDGQRPQSCSRCEKRQFTCAYEPHVKTHKDDLIKEIEALREDKTRLEDEKQQLADAKAGLQSENKDLTESSGWSNTILQTISKNGHDKEIVTKLRSGESHREVADWLTQQIHVKRHINIEPNNNSRRDLLNVVKDFESQYQDEDGLSRGKRARSNDSDIVWTNVSSSQTLIGHLFDLYFTWVHPIHMLFSELDFKYSFRTNEGHYCSRALVNAICAMACHLLENEGAHSPKLPQGAIGDAATLREGFMNEARKHLTRKTYHEMTSVQAFAVMYLVEFSSSKARKALGYLRSAVENVISATKNQSMEAQEITAWGINTLNTASVGITYQKFYTPDLPHEVSFEHVRMDKDDAIWRFYRSVGDEKEMPTRPSHAILTAYFQAKLFRICRDCMNLYCGYSGKITAHKVITLYKHYTEWKLDLPAALQQVDIEAQPLPNVLYLHVVYHTALLQHLMPLLSCHYFSAPDEDELRRMTVYHARCGLESLEHSRRLYTTRYQTPLLSFCILHLGDALLRYSPNEPPASDVAVFCMEMLSKTSAGFAICGPISALFRQTAVELNVELPPAADGEIGEPIEYPMDEILDACTRLTYRQPTEQIIRLMDNSIANNWVAEWEEQVVQPNQKRSRRESSSGRYLQIGSLLNG